MTDSLIGRALEVAGGELGVREYGGPNRGPAVERYLRHVFAQPGQPWCCAFVVWCLWEAAAQLGLACTVPRVAAVHRLWNRAEERRVPWPPPPGAVFCHDRGHGQGHTGFVVEVIGDNIRTIEGNANVAGSAEGDGVYELVRPKDYVNLGYLLFGPISEDDTPTAPVRIHG